MTDPIDKAVGEGAAAVLIAGPTASGKSRLALDVAGRHGGVVVNADSMQVYGALRVLTARPTSDDEARVPHRLYGHVDAGERYSVGRWLSDVAAVLGAVRDAGRLAVVVGGTGLYFKALTEGLAAIPDIPYAVRTRLAEEAEGTPSAALHLRLAEVDPEGAAVIRETDRSRILRALEVFEATGRPLTRWQAAEPLPPLIEAAMAVRVVIGPERSELHRRIGERAEAMVHAGALAEVEALARRALDPALPVMKAIGVRPLLDHIAGDISLDEAIASIKTETRRYAKRQETWFRHQTSDWLRLVL